MFETLSTPDFLFWERKGFDRLCIMRRLKTLGLTNSMSRSISSCMLRWVTNEGPKGYLLNVERQRAAWIAFDSGLQVEIPGCSRRNGVPVQTRFLRQVNAHTRYQVLKFLKACIKYEKLQVSQWQKFINSATRPRPEQSAINHAVDVVLSGFDASLLDKGQVRSWEKGGLLSHEPCEALYNLPADPGRTTFAPFDQPKSRPRDPLSVFSDSLKLISSSPLFGGTVPGFIPTMEWSNPPETAGLIGVTQEPGGKARFFVSVHPVYQADLSPLHRCLAYVAKRDPNSFAFRQDAGRSWVRKSLEEGTVWSFDLSDATNTFPYALQRALLVRAGITHSFVKARLISAMSNVISKDFRCCEEIETLTGVKTVKFSVGQPLGLLPSAMLFHLTHIYLLRGLEYGLYGRSNRRRFGVVLDDVVITDRALAEAYRSLMDSIGVPISLSKSLVSDQMAEFLGRIITPTSVIELTKQSRLTFNNVKDYSQVFGPALLKELPEKVSKVLKPVLALPSCLGGGGLGCGIPLRTRVNDPKVADWLMDTLSERPESVRLMNETTRVRELVKVVRDTKGVKPTESFRVYLTRLLPRRRSQLANAHRVHPRHGVAHKRTRATRSVIAIKGNEFPCVLIREDADYSAARSLNQVRSSLRSVASVLSADHVSRLLKWYNNHKRTATQS